jgi:hypothetical protein
MACGKAIMPPDCWKFQFGWRRFGAVGRGTTMKSKLTEAQIAFICVRRDGLQGGDFGGDVL